MIPILFSENPNNIEYNGIPISEATSCLVTEDLDGKFELKLTLTKDGNAYKHLKKGISIIEAKANEEGTKEWFRVYSISSSLSKVITVKARHIGYDVSGIFFDTKMLLSKETNEEKEQNVPYVLWYLKNTSFPGAYNQNEIWVANPNFDVVIDMKNEDGIVPKIFPVSKEIESVRKVMFGEENSIISIFGGEIKVTSVYSEELKKRIPQFEWFKRRGGENGAFVQYAINMIDYQLAETAEGQMYTHILGVCEFNDKILSHLQETTLNVGNIAPKTEKIDYTKQVGEKATEAEAQEALQALVTKDAAKDFSKPESLEVSFADIKRSMESEGKKSSSIALGDTVTVITDTKAKFNLRCVETVYDTLKEEYKTLTIGRAKETIIDTIGRLKA
jgi:phage-related protein